MDRAITNVASHSQVADHLEKERLGHPSDESASIFGGIEVSGCGPGKDYVSVQNESEATSSTRAAPSVIANGQLKSPDEPANK